MIAGVWREGASTEVFLHAISKTSVTSSQASSTAASVTGLRLCTGKGQYEAALPELKNSLGPTIGLSISVFARTSHTRFWCCNLAVVQQRQMHDWYLVSRKTFSGSAMTGKHCNSVVQEDSLKHYQLLMLLSANVAIKVLLTLAFLQGTLSQSAASALLARPYCPGKKYCSDQHRLGFDNFAKFGLKACSSVLVLCGHQCKGCSQHISKRHSCIIYTLACNVSWYPH